MESLADLRTEITTIDTTIVALLRERFDIVKKIGSIKAEQGIAVEDTEREAALAALYTDLADEYHIERGCVQTIFETIIKESKRIQAEG